MGDITTYTWSYENQLVGVEQPDDVVITYAYAPVNKNSDELRFSKETDAGTVQFVWDNQNIIRELDETGLVEAEYTLNPQPYGALVSQHQDSESTFYNFDALGSTESLTDATQTKTDEYVYDAFGTILAQSGSTPNKFTFVGELGYYFDAETGQYSVRRRQYGPDQNRFTSEDPILFEGGTPNLYEYVGNNPVTGVDPSGTEEIAYPYAYELEQKPASPSDPDEFRGKFQPSRRPTTPTSYSGCRWLGTTLQYFTVSGYARTNRESPGAYDIGQAARCSSGPMIQRDGKYLPYALVIDICQRNSTIPNARLTPQDWDQIFEEWGTFQCQPTVPAPSQPAAAPPQQPQIRYCPPPEESSQQYGYVETTFEAAFYKKIFFGEQPAVVRVYFSPDTPENRDIARDMLRRQKILTYLTDELKEDVNVGVIAPADMAARAAFDTVDDIDTWVEVRKNPTLCGILGAVAGTFIIGYGVHKVRQSRKAADGPGPRPVPKPLAQARGGTYVLRDPVTGRVMRTGRTNDLARRQLEHARDPALRDYVFEPVHRTDVYAEQRGLEQLLHETHNPPLNRIRGISPTNPRLPEYRDAAQRFLERQQGGQ